MQDPQSYSVAARFAQMRPQDFRESVADVWQFTQTIIDNIAKGVESQVISPLQGIQVVSCTVGSFFGYEDFHPRGDTNSSELVSTLLRETSQTGQQAKQRDQALAGR